MKIAIAVFFLLFAQSVFSQTPERVVRQYIADYNSRSVDKMLDVITDDFQWLSISGEKTARETSGKEELKNSLESYFKNCPSCRSEIIWIKATKARATVFEKAKWKDKAGKPREQSGLSVYEFRDKKIARVYYFPAEK